MSPAEVVIHTVVPPGIGRIVHVYEEGREGDAVAALVTGRDASGMWVLTFPPPGSPFHPGAVYLNFLPDTPTPGERRFYWRWPPRT